MINIFTRFKIDLFSLFNELKKSTKYEESKIFKEIKNKFYLEDFALKILYEYFVKNIERYESCLIWPEEIVSELKQILPNELFEKEIDKVFAGNERNESYLELENTKKERFKSQIKIRNLVIKKIYKAYLEYSEAKQISLHKIKN